MENNHEIHPLTNEQVNDLFIYVAQNGKLTDNDNQFSMIASISKEEITCDLHVPDFNSVYLNSNGWPVAAAAPLDSLFYIL